MRLSTDLPLAVRPTRIRFVVVAALCVAAAVAYIQRNSYGAADTTITHSLHLTDSQTGAAASLFFLSYALLQVPSGWLAQRRGRVSPSAASRPAGPWPSGLCAGRQSVHAHLRPASHGSHAGRHLLPCSTLIVAAWLPPTQRGTASGLLNSFMLIGGALSSNLTGLLIDPLGWRGLFLLFAAPGLVWACFFCVWFRNRPADHRAVNDAELAVIERAAAGAAKAAPSRSPVRWSALLLSGALYLICLQQFFRAGANRFFDNTFATYLQEGRRLGVGFANQLASLPQWVGVVGGLVGGVLSDYLLVWTGSRRIARQALAVGSLVACLVLYAIRLLHLRRDAGDAHGLGRLFHLLLLPPCAYALTMDMGGRNLGVVFGAMNMAGNFGACAFTWVAPQLSGWFHPEWPPAVGLGAAGQLASPTGQGPSWRPLRTTAGPPRLDPDAGPLRRHARRRPRLLAAAQPQRRHRRTRPAARTQGECSCTNPCRILIVMRGADGLR